ncbi:MAG: 3-methyl-2-oxobutanoate hydroxymethyltransferase [Alphaproteobacteria bacterium]|nr:3-methyl-2-oxobutanoate hydroxymethyltransferase [Alphaproteobacteria bacterium]
MRKTPRDIQKRKNAPQPLVCMTAYTVNIARILDRHADILLVGDSLGMVIYGMESTLGVTLDMMIAHGKAVMRATQRACIVVDMPYGTYEDSPAQALKSAQYVMHETGCDAVKLEGGAAMAPAIALLVQNNIPVMAHIGLLPQSVEREGGYKIKGKTEEDIQRLIADAKAVEAAGAFSVVIEGTIEGAATAITDAISIPTIGIGASPQCDGQVLVSDDFLGLTPLPRAKFVKTYADLENVIDGAAAAFATEIRARQFPSTEFLYGARK